ncbi:AAA family ATPase [Paludisphaera mucosa]|uniref:AAA family ATPase n=1 Tax=Paludisphaera mucosa TaxID=3030827 RepID=A0ABT6FIU8_9BACT|nr:AAA family ATPase [Paludisphaera mucosa]MDG3007475.1 AAA family ATPase [Paludisphaera mucosa]
MTTDFDRRVAGFCSPTAPDPFHAVASATDVWRPDPFDVETIHGRVRAWFDRAVERARDVSGPSTGRLLLLLGESGSGKTHLMRAFRSRVHGAGRGYCAYMQMTSYTGDYARYALNNVIDSLDRPYFEGRDPESALRRLSDRLVDLLGDARREAVERLREGGLGQAAVDVIVAETADDLIRDERLARVDVYLIQALLYLQAGDPAIHARLVKYLRCEDLNDRDRRYLGDVDPNTYADAPSRMIARIGGLIHAVERAPLVICLDQLEDVFDLDQAAAKFRRAMATLCDLLSRVPSAIVVVSCLENFYDELKPMLTRSTRDRVENDPRPAVLETPCGPEDVRALIARRLESLFRSGGVDPDPDEPTAPVPEALVSALVGLRARDVLQECQAYRERCVEEGKMAVYPRDDAARAPRPGPTDEAQRALIEIEQAWNDFRSAQVEPVPTEEPELAQALTWALRDASDEAGDAPDAVRVQVDGRFVTFEGPRARFVAGLCNRAAQGGWLGKQIDELEGRAAALGWRAVAVRSTPFPPRHGKTQVAATLAEFESQRGRCVVVEDSAWRAIAAFAAFRDRRGAAPVFEAWRRRNRPLTGLDSLRTMLDQDAP